MLSITERFLGLMPTMWSSRSTATEASATLSPPLGVGANEESIIVSMSTNNALGDSTSTPSSATEAAPNSGSTTFTASLRNIFISVREKCSSAFTTIRTSIASAFTKVVTWVSNLRPGNRDQAEPGESPKGGASSNPLTNPNPIQPAHTTAEEDQQTPSGNLSAGEEVVDQTGSEISTGDVSDRELDLDESESRDGSDDASLKEEVDDGLFQSCILHPSEPVALAEAEPVITEKPSPAAAQVAVDESVADAQASLDAIETIAGGMVTCLAVEASSVPLIQEAQARTFAEPSGRRSPSAPLFPNDTERFSSAEPFIRRSSFADVGDLFDDLKDQQAGAGRRRSSSMELELRGLTPTTSKMAEAPSTQAATSPSKGGGKQKAKKK